MPDTDTTYIEPPPLPARPARKYWLFGTLGGCLGCIGAGVVVLMALFIGGAFVVMDMVKSSGAYEQAVARATADPQVQALLGTPIEEGFFVTGSVSTHYGSGGSTGEADLAIPISGPDGKATIFVEGTQSNNVWTFSRMTVIFDDGRPRIDLLEPE